MAQIAKRTVTYLAVSQAFGQIMTAMILSATALAPRGPSEYTVPAAWQSGAPAWKATPPRP